MGERGDLCICIHICWYWQADSDWSLLSFEVLLDTGSESRNRAEQKPSGLVNHPKYHSHSGDVCLCRHMSVCLSGGARRWRAVCPPSLPEACLCVSYGSWHSGTSSRWQMTQTGVDFEAFGTGDWPNRDCVCGPVEREDTRTAPSSCMPGLIFRLLTGTSYSTRPILSILSSLNQVIISQWQLNVCVHRVCVWAWRGSRILGSHLASSFCLKPVLNNKAPVNICQ